MSLVDVSKDVFLDIITRISMEDVSCLRQTCKSLQKQIDAIGFRPCVAKVSTVDYSQQVWADYPKLNLGSYIPWPPNPVLTKQFEHRLSDEYFSITPINPEQKGIDKLSKVSVYIRYDALDRWQPICIQLLWARFVEKYRESLASVTKADFRVDWRGHCWFTNYDYFGVNFTADLPNLKHLRLEGFSNFQLPNNLRSVELIRSGISFSSIPSSVTSLSYLHAHFHSNVKLICQLTSLNLTCIFSETSLHEILSSQTSLQKLILMPTYSKFNAHLKLPELLELSIRIGHESKVQIDCPKLISLGLDFGDYTGDLTINCPNANVKTIFSMIPGDLNVSNVGKLRASVKSWNCAIRANLDYLELNVKEPIKTFSIPVFCREVILNAEISKKIVTSVSMLKKVAKHAKNATSLVILKEEDPSRLLPYFTRFKTLRLSYFNVEPQTVLQWPQCEQLTRLELVKMRHDAPVTHIWKSCPNLETLEISVTNAIINIIDLLTCLKKLKKLILNGKISINMQDVIEMKGKNHPLHTLKAYRVESCTAFEKAQLREIFPHLEVFVK